MSESASIEYNRDFSDLEKLLAGVVRPGDFFASGMIETPMPRVEVQGAGVLSFPVLPAQIADLIATASRAPYGRGEKTIVDESVRKVWQVPAPKVKLGGKSWPRIFQDLLERVAAGLGCEGLTVKAELYKLLIYDEGAFFLSHRDTEKVPGMFGTLVLVLPSSHRGGELIVRHAGREVTIDLSTADSSEIAYAAFFADCEHEVRPITGGHRVCLVYNLIHSRAAGAPPVPAAPDHSAHVSEAAGILQRGFGANGGCVKLAWLLEHEYSPAGLSFDALKGADAARTQVLASAAKLAGCAVHLGIVHIEEIGAAEPNYDDYRSRRYREEDEEEDEDGADFEVMEVIESFHYIGEWRDLTDRSMDFGPIPLLPEELLPDGGLDGVKPDTQKLMEASGNEGATFERAYLRAALVIWRADRFLEVLLQAGVEAALPTLEEQITAFENAAPPDAGEQARATAAAMITDWPGLAEESDERPDMLRLLARLGDTKLIERFVSKVVAHQFDGRETLPLAHCISLLKAPAAARLLTGLVSRRASLWPGKSVELMRHLPALADPKREKPWTIALEAIAQSILEGLEKFVHPPPSVKTPWWTTAAPAKREKLEANFASELLQTFATLKIPSLCDEAAKRLIAHPDTFPPVDFIVPALATLAPVLQSPMRAALTRLWEHCATFLLRRSDTPPIAPRDWRQDVVLRCACEDCRALQRFVHNPDLRVLRLPVNKERRQHLHRVIDDHRLEITHVTERLGTPHTLVCTKDRRHFRARCVEYLADLAAMRMLAALSPAIAPSARSLSKLRTAIDKGHDFEIPPKAWG